MFYLTENKCYIIYQAIPILYLSIIFIYKLIYQPFNLISVFTKISLNSIKFVRFYNLINISKYTKQSSWLFLLLLAWSNFR